MEKFMSYITNSQNKVFTDSTIKESITQATMFRNEAISFVVAYKTEPGRTHDATCLPISISAECDIAEVNVYKICFVPVICGEQHGDEVGSENKGSGLYPDILYKRNAVPEIAVSDNTVCPFYEEDEKYLLNATDVFQSVLITVNENGSKISAAGKHKLVVKITSLTSGDTLSEHVVNLKIIDQELPESELMYTNWFHYDCIADIHAVKLYSEEYFTILESYFKNAVKHGMNTILTPVFTPPLDTVIGGERQNVQLVKVIKNADGYEFDFSLFKKFILLALECGFKYFEHSHLFSQWGAEHSPNIYAEINGKEKRIFGWETEASGKEYKAFLNEYIPAFLKFAKEMKIDDKLFFHISDEPTESNQKSYGKAVETVGELLDGYRRGDALDDLCFYENGFVKTPIVRINRAEDFFGKCEGMWLYYTSGQGTNLYKCSNRLITSKPYKTRILGLHLYKYRCSGFLHWGYNYFYDRMSNGLVDPKVNPCGYKNMPGASYIVYPGINCVHSSLREKYMLEAITDYRALKLLETYIGYEEVIKLCEAYFGEPISFTTIPRNEKQMMGFRELINSEIEKFKEE